MAAGESAAPNVRNTIMNTETIELMDNYLALFDSGKINSTELAELFLKLKVGA